MAISIGSPWGILIGKLGPAVGFRWRGMNLVRMKGKAKHRGSYEWLEKVRRGEIDKGEVSKRLANAVSVRWGVNWLVKEGYSRIIYPVWEKLVRGRALTGGNLFFRENFPNLYYSIPERDKFISEGNLPDMMGLCLTDGILEGSEIEGVEYKDGIIRAKWGVECYRDGDADDGVHLFAVYLDKRKEAKWGPMILWGRLRLWGDGRLSIGKRGDGEGFLKVDKGLDARCLTVYLGFSNSGLGYSRTSGARIGKAKT